MSTTSNSADTSDVIITVESDEEGEARLVSAPAFPTGARLYYHMGLSAPRTLRHAWAANPICVQCDRHIASHKDAGLIVMPDRSHRIACRKTCFVRAVVRFNPLLSTAAALTRAPHLVTPVKPVKHPKPMGRAS